MTLPEMVKGLFLRCDILGQNLSKLKVEVREIKRETRKESRKYIDSKTIELSKLVDDCVGVLKLLQEKGIVTTEELAEATK